MAAPLRRFALASLGIVLGTGLGPGILPRVASAQAPEPGAALPTVAELFDRDAWGKNATGLAWSPDGKALAYVWDDGEGEALWVLDPETGRSAKRLTASDLAAAAAEGTPPVLSDPPPSLGESAWLPDGSGF